MPTYTADAVALLAYLVDALPDRADRIFAEAEAGETVVQAPSTAVAEVLYAVSRDKDVRGVTLTGSPDEARRALLDNGPASLVPADETDIAEYATIVDDVGIHDAFVVASHRVHDTDAIITSDGVLRDATVETVWN